MTATFAEVQARALSAKQNAKAVRNKWRDQPESAARASDFEAAIAELTEVVKALRDWSATESAYRREADREIGDCLGVEGGTYRDWGRFDGAASAYDRGLPFEQRAEELGSQPNSYCLVQRLVCRILFDPEAFLKSLPILGVEVEPELERAAGIVRAQIPNRNDAVWARADLASILQLLASKRRVTFDQARVEWDAFEDMRPERSVYDSTRKAVLAIKERLDPLLDQKARDEWEDVVDRLAL